MHEMGYCVKLIDQVIDACKDNDIKKVYSVDVSVGEMTGCVDELLITAFNEAKKGTILSDANLNIFEQEVVAFCENCNKEFKPNKDNNYACPICKGYNSKIIRGKDCIIERITAE